VSQLRNFLPEKTMLVFLSVVSASTVTNAVQAAPNVAQTSLQPDDGAGAVILSGDAENALRDVHRLTDDSQPAAVGGGLALSLVPADVPVTEFPRYLAAAASTNVVPELGDSPADVKSDTAQVDAGQNRPRPIPTTTLQPAPIGKRERAPGLMLAQTPPPGIGRPGDDLDDADIALGLGMRQPYSDLLSLEDRIVEMARPVANAVTRYSTQSDHVDISQSEISADFFFADGAHHLRPGVQYVTYIPRTGDRVNQYSAGFDGNYRFTDWAGISGNVWANEIQSKNVPDAVIATYDVFLTLWPNDYFRVDIDTKRETFDNITSLRMGIIANSVGGSIDFMPTSQLRLSLRGGNSWFTDDNERQNYEGEVIYRLASLPTIDIGGRVSGFHFSKLLSNGYFNPENYTSEEAIFRVQSDLTNKLTVELAASGGVEQADPGGDKGIVKASLQMTYKLTDNWLLGAGVSYFSSRESNSSGFERSSVNAGLHYKFN
jgi:hypothetical protein